jgi:hypothetical protein
VSPVHGDARSRRIAVVPDHVANPRPGDPDTFGALVAGGWGIVVLPAADLLLEVAAAWRAAAVEQVAVFAGDGYEIRLVEPQDAASQAFARALALY